MSNENKVVPLFPNFRKGQKAWLIGFIAIMVIAVAVLVSGLVYAKYGNTLRVNGVQWKMAAEVEAEVYSPVYTTNEDKVPIEAINVHCPGRPADYVCELNDSCDPSITCTYQLKERTLMRSEKLAGTDHVVIRPDIEITRPDEVLTVTEPEFKVNVTDGKHTWDVTVDRERFLNAKPGEPFDKK